MNIYAQIKDGRAHWIFQAEEAPEFSDEIVIVDITAVTPMPQEGWSYDGSTFAAPVPYQPAPEEIESTNTATKQLLQSQASIAMTPLFLSLQLGNATDAETVKAKAWQTYYRDLQAIDVTVFSPEWPVAPA